MKFMYVKIMYVGKHTNLLEGKGGSRERLLGPTPTVLKKKKMSYTCINLKQIL